MTRGEGEVRRVASRRVEVDGVFRDLSLLALGDRFRSGVVGVGDVVSDMEEVLVGCWEESGEFGHQVGDLLGASAWVIMKAADCGKMVAAFKFRESASGGV